MTSEDRDDTEARVSFVPNGEDVHYYNQRDGGRWFRAAIPDLSEEWEASR